MNGRSSDLLLILKPSRCFKSDTSGKDVSKIYKRSFTAAGLFGTYTQFPFNPNDENLHPKPIRDKDKEKTERGRIINKKCKIQSHSASSIIDILTFCHLVFSM